MGVWGYRHAQAGADQEGVFACLATHRAPTVAQEHVTLDLALSRETYRGRALGSPHRISSASSSCSLLAHSPAHLPAYSLACFPIRLPTCLLGCPLGCLLTCQLPCPTTCHLVF